MRPCIEPEPLPEWMIRRMVAAVRDNLSVPDRLLVQRALTERTERVCVLFGPYGGLQCTDREFASLMLRISKVALTSGGPA